MIRFKTYSKLKEVSVGQASYKGGPYTLGADEEVLKNPTFMELRRILAGTAVKELVRCWAGKKDVLVWTGFDTEHGDLDPGKYISGPFNQVYLGFRNDKMLDRVELSVYDTDARSNKSTEALARIKTIPWITQNSDKKTKYGTQK